MFALLPFLKPFIGMLALLGAVLGAYAYGGHVAKQDCARQKQESINLAREIDTKAAEQALARMLRQNQAAEARMAEAEKKVKDYEAKLKNTPECSLDDDDVRALDGVPNGPEVPSGSQKPTPNR